MNSLLWLIIALLFFIIEFLTPGIFLFSCFGIGAIVALIVSLLTRSLLVQCTIFAVSSILSIYLLKPVLMKLLMPLTLKTNVDSLINKKGVVIEKIEGQRSMGIVKVDNELWRAVSEDGSIIDKDEEVVVVRVNGAHLIVKKS